MDLNTEREILKPLVEELLKFALLPIQATKKELWGLHQTLMLADKIPVCVYYEGIPSTQWELMLGKNILKTVSPLAREIEFDLRKRLWMVKNVPDDHIVWPMVTIRAVVSRQADWGVPVKWVGIDKDDNNPEHARKIEPPFKNGIENEKILFTNLDIANRETAKLVNHAAELLDGKLSVFVYYENLGFSPFDRAVEFRGIEKLLYDVVDAPEKVKALMGVITDSMILHHRNREEKGWINAYSPDNKYLAVPMRVHAAPVRKDFDQRKLRLFDEWAYVSSQTSSGLGPDMYAEFVQPYNEKLAEFFTRKTVYYHGCESLDQKASIIKKLPNLRRFHISPWSDIMAIREETEDSFVYEIHDHPGKVFFGMNKKDMKASIKKLVDAAKGAIFDLNLSDIHSVNGNPMLLKDWAEAAQEAVQ